MYWCFDSIASLLINLWFQMAEKKELLSLRRSYPVQLIQCK